MSENYSLGLAPLQSDPQRVIEVKILRAINAATCSGGTGGNSGTGSPEGVVTASPGATYLDTSSNSLWAKNSGTGNTGWVQLIA